MKNLVEIDTALIKKNKERTRVILMAEDDAINVFIMQKLLLPLKFELHVAENGFRAVEMFKERIYDVILMDIYMPIMDGLEASKQIRAISPLTPPIIAVTAAVLKKETIKLEYGIDFVVNKPVGIFELKNLLYQLL